MIASDFPEQKCPKVPESGTPRAGNQLVRMRSPNHSLKDIEAEAALTRHFLTPERAAQPKRKKQEATSGPLFFHAPQRTATRPLFFVPRPMPRRASKRQQSPRGQRPRACQPIGGGLRRRGQNLWPRLAPGPDNLPRFARGGPPASQVNSSFTFKTLKSAKKGLQSGWIKCKMFPRKTE